MKQVIAAVDFSDLTELVIEQAGQVARAFSARLTLLHVAAGEPDFVGYDAGPQSVRDGRASQLRQEHEDLQALAERLREAGIEAEALLVEGATVETILGKAQELETDLIVVGSHGKGALRTALLGSVSQGLVRKAGCPLLIVPAENRGE